MFLKFAQRTSNVILRHKITKNKEALFVPLLTNTRNEMVSCLFSTDEKATNEKIADILEKEMDAVNMLLTAPLDRGHIFSAKMIIFMLFLLLAEIMLFPLFSFFMNFQGTANLQFWGLVLLVNWALSAIGILASGIGFKSRLGEVLTSLLLFPFSVPVMISSIKSTKSILGGDTINQFDEWLMILLTLKRKRLTFV